MKETQSLSDIVSKISEEYSGVSLSTSRWWPHKALDKEEISKLAAQYQCEETEISGKKKLISTADDSYRAITAIFRESKQLYTSLSIPYPQNGLRLMPKTDLEAFRKEVHTFANRLELAVKDFERALPDLADKHKDKIGKFWRKSDYPTSLAGEYSITYDVYDVNPPSYLTELDPALFREQLEKAQDRIRVSVTMFENDLVNELDKFVHHMSDALEEEPVDGGRRRGISEKSVVKINKLLERFRSLDLCSSKAINELAAKAQGAIEGRTIKQMRTDSTTRSSMRESFNDLKESVGKLIEARAGRQFEPQD